MNDALACLVAIVVACLATRLACGFLAGYLDGPPGDDDQ
jgi:hypothetical protein